MYNIGDIIYQLFAFAFLFGIIYLVFFFIRSLIKQNKKSEHVEKKLDRIIELLEKNHKE